VDRGAAQTPPRRDPYKAADMNRIVLAVALFVTTSIHAAETARYLVATRPAAAKKLSLVRDPIDAERHDVRELATINAFAADLTEEEAAALRKSPEVRYVTRTVERHLLDTSAAQPPFRMTANFSHFGDTQQVPYGVDLVHARELWPYTKGGGSINVAILDTGIDATHPDLKANYAGGYNTFTKLDDPIDDHRHGTHVAGTIAAADNGIGVVGIAPETHIWAVKVLNSRGTGEDENVIAALEWVRAKKHQRGGQWIVSMSLGSDVSSSLEAEAFARANDHGILSIAAAGNTGLTVPHYPAAYPNVVAVAAVDSDSHIAEFSSGGAGLQVSAPGVDVISTVPVGLIKAGAVQAAGGARLDAIPLTGAPRNEVTAPFVFCGYGQESDFAGGRANGKIAVMQRGILKFAEKGRNARAGGAVGVIVYNDVDRDDRTTWTLIRPDCDTTSCHDYEPDVTFDWAPTVALTKVDGEKLAQTDGTTTTLTMGGWDEDYTSFSGTSMATPHVSGVAALLWSLAPDATATDVTNALIRGAHDLGDIGFDARFGYGLIDAVTAAKQIAPSRFGLPAPPPPTNPLNLPRRRVEH
jgi:serine protease